MRLLEGAALNDKDTLIKINALGLIKSKREDCEDHYVYFGSAEEMNGKIVNDVVCQRED